MAASRASTSAVTLEDWDALAPLDERAKASLAALTDASNEKPLPKRLAKAAMAAAATPTTRPGTPSYPSHPQNLLRRAASRMDMFHGSSAAPSAPDTPRPRSPAQQRILFSSPQQLDRGHNRQQSTATIASALAMQIHPAIEGSSSYPGSPRKGTARLREPQRDPLEIVSPIETTQQFLDWYSGVEASMESEQEEVFRRYEVEVEAYIDSCDEALELLEDSRGLIKEMEANYRFVEENSRALQMACEAMLDEQKHLLEVTDAINSRLEYFKELEIATRALSQPGDTVVLQEDFLGMLHRLDVCLEFLSINRNYRDAEVYLIRFQQCLTRAMTLIRMHFLQALTSTYTEVSGRLAASSVSGKGGPANLSETALNALLYAKFSAISETSRTLLYELEKRANANPAEYGSLLQECFANWFNVRTQLLAPNLAEEVRRMDPQNTDLVKLARSGCAYLRTVCASEWSLFRDFFPSSGQTELYHFLETLCDYLYDSLRPRILHETKLEVLCELCNVIQALISLDGDGEDEDAASDEGRPEAGGDAQYAVVPDDSSFNLSMATVTEAGLIKAGPKMRFSELLGTVLQDAQTRLVFRAQYVMEAEVLNYAPRPEELDYPSMLVESRGKGKGKESTSLAQWQKENGGCNAMGVVEEDGVTVFKLPPEEIMASWYPTLKKMLWVLSRLHSYVNTAIFQDFAGEAVNLCRQSLNTAAEKISARPGASRLDGQLFVIRHLLIMKEMVRSMDLVQVERAMDFSNMTDALASLLRNTSTLLNPNALYQLASKGMPSFAETMRDAKHDLDSSLKLICEDFMTQSSLIVSSNIRAFLTRCQAFLSSAPAAAAPPDVTTQEWASSEEVMKLHDAFMAEGQGLEKGIREILEKMNIFLDEEKTVAVLIPPMLAEVLDHYTTFYDLVRSEYDYATANAMTPPARVRERLRAIAGSTSAGWTKERDAL